MALKDAKRCNATSKSTGQRCKNPAMKGSDKCRLHGGKTPKGLASPNLKHGRYSKHLPTRMMSRYEAAENDADLIALRGDIALIDARIVDVLGRVDTGESGVMWNALKDLFDDLNQSISDKEASNMAKTLTDIRRLINRGVADYATWGEVTKLLEQRRKLVESERKRLMDMEQMITTEKAMLLIGSISSVIREHVTDRNQLAAITRDLSNILS